MQLSHFSLIYSLKGKSAVLLSLLLWDAGQGNLSHLQSALNFEHALGAWNGHCKCISRVSQWFCPSVPRQGKIPRVRGCFEVSSQRRQSIFRSRAPPSPITSSVLNVVSPTRKFSGVLPHFVDLVLLCVYISWFHVITLFLAKEQTKCYLFLQLPDKWLFLGRVNYM